MWLTALEAKATLGASTHCSVFEKQGSRLLLHDGKLWAAAQWANQWWHITATGTTTKIGTEITQTTFTHSSCVQGFDAKLKTSEKLSSWSYSPPHARQPPRAVCLRARVSAVKRDMCLWSWTHQRGTACAPAGCCRTGTGCHRHHKCRVLKNHKAHRSVDSFVIGRKWIHLSIYEPLLCRTTAGSAISLTLVSLFFFCNCFTAQKLQKKN